jgi:hypothetical protein
VQKTNVNQYFADLEKSDIYSPLIQYKDIDRRSRIKPTGLNTQWMHVSYTVNNVTSTQTSSKLCFHNPVSHSINYRSLNNIQRNTTTPCLSTNRNDWRISFEKHTSLTRWVSKIKHLPVHVLHKTFTDTRSTVKPLRASTLQHETQCNSLTIMNREHTNAISCALNI